MKRLFFILCLTVFWIVGCKEIVAQGEVYRIERLDSKAIIQKDYSLLVEINVEVLFNKEGNGIVWYLPSDSTEDKIKILSVTDGKGDILPYKSDNTKSEKKLIIGDQNRKASGKQIYRIKYLTNEKIKEINGNIEIWSVLTGFRRDAVIDKTYITIESPYLKIVGTGGAISGANASKYKGDFFKLKDGKISLAFDYPLEDKEYISAKIVFEKPVPTIAKKISKEIATDKKSIAYALLLALVMILLAILIRKKH